MCVVLTSLVKGKVVTTKAAIIFALLLPRSVPIRPLALLCDDGRSATTYREEGARSFPSTHFAPRRLSRCRDGMGFSDGRTDLAGLRHERGPCVNNATVRAFCALQDGGRRGIFHGYQEGHPQDVDCFFR